MAESNSLKRCDDTPCDQCGRYGAWLIDGRALCDDCYAEAGTCGAAPDDDPRAKPGSAPG